MNREPIGADIAAETPEPCEVFALSVAELNRKLRRAVEDVTGRDWVIGEVASCKRAASGHVYFALKDEREDAMLDCVMYRNQGIRFLGLIADGAKIQILGKATLWSPRGKLQFIVERVTPAGRGVLLEALERLKAKLAGEGLFAKERKRSLPTEPRVVGVVTSPRGAAFWDVVAVAARRGPTHLVLSPALVQGEGAVRSLLDAIDLIERYPGIDVLIVGRGGGAGEDLMAFNDERLVRRIAQTKVPVVSAVGHDIDVTLADLVADVRAATPSQAAELVVVDSVTRVEQRVRLHQTLLAAMQRRIVDDRSTVGLLRARIKDPRFVVLSRQQQLDELKVRLSHAARLRLRAPAGRLVQLKRRLAERHPRWVLGSAKAALTSFRHALRVTESHHVQMRRASWTVLSVRLDALSPLAVLGRGYAIASRLDGRVIRGPDDIGQGELFRLRLDRGDIWARFEEKSSGRGNEVDGAPRGIDDEPS